MFLRPSSFRFEFFYLESYCGNFPTGWILEIFTKTFFQFVVSHSIKLIGINNFLKLWIVIVLLHRNWCKFSFYCWDLLLLVNASQVEVSFSMWETQTSISKHYLQVENSKINGWTAPIKVWLWLLWSSLGGLISDEKLTFKKLLEKHGPCDMTV